MNGIRRLPSVQRTETQYMVPGTTFSKLQAVADAAEGFLATEMKDNTGELPDRAHILVQTNNMRYAENVAPTTGALGYPVTAGNDIWLDGLDAIQNFQYINDTGAQQVTLIVTFYYKK